VSSYNGSIHHFDSQRKGEIALSETALVDSEQSRGAIQGRAVNLFGSGLTESDYTALEGRWIDRGLADQAKLRRVDASSGGDRGPGGLEHCPVDRCQSQRRHNKHQVRHDRQGKSDSCLQEFPRGTGAGLADVRQEYRQHPHPQPWRPLDFVNSDRNLHSATDSQKANSRVTAMGNTLDGTRRVRRPFLGSVTCSLLTNSDQCLAVIPALLALSVMVNQ
jgi:hypothetical protein